MRREALSDNAILCSGLLSFRITGSLRVGQGCFRMLEYSAQGGLRLGTSYAWQWCAPTRGALLSGRFPMHTGYDGGGMPGDGQGMPLEVPLLAGELRSPGGFTRLMMRMPALIQEETRLVTLAEAMADAQQVHEVQPGQLTEKVEEA